MKQSDNKAFTLIEMLVTAGIFAVLIIIVASIFVIGIRVENNVFATKKTLAQISYATEYITRALRMAEKDTGQGCIPFGKNYHISGAGERISFRNALQDGDCEEFFLENNQIKYSTPTGTFELTSSDITIENLQFNAYGEAQGDVFQPFVTIYFEAYSANSPVLEIQTSVSQRNPDITK